MAEKEFMDKVMPCPVTGCWYFTGAVDKDGYGIIYHEKRVWKSHRLSYKMFIGEITGELHVCHQCDQPSCINPSHLFLGTHADNMRDMFKKKRRKAAKGDKCRSTRLTKEDVIDIRTSYVNGGVYYRDLTFKYKVSITTIAGIVKGKKWKWIDE